MVRTSHIRPLALAWIGMAFGLTYSEASAGVILFEPETVFVEPGERLVAFELTIVADDPFDSLDLIIGSDLPVVGFAYAFETPIIVEWFGPIGIYEHDLLITANGPNLVGPTFLVGTLTLDTSNGSPGRYAVWVDSERDGVSVLGARGVAETVAGYGYVVVPEPGALSLLALGVSAIARRRRSAE